MNMNYTGDIKEAISVDDISIQLFQFSVNEAFYKIDATPAISLLRAIKKLDETTLNQLTDLRSVVRALRPTNDVNTVSLVFNTLMVKTDAGANLGYKAELGGVQIGDDEVVAKGTLRNVVVTPVGIFKADRFNEDGDPVFTVSVKNRVRFSENIRVSEVAEFLSGGTYKTEMFLPVIDTHMQFKCVLATVVFTELFMMQSRQTARPGEKCRRFHEIFTGAGRMGEDEARSIQQGNQKFHVATVKSYGNYKKLYCFPARDLEIVASDGLVKLLNDRVDERRLDIPESIKEAAKLYTQAKEVIKDKMDARSDLIQQLADHIREHFTLEGEVDAKLVRYPIPMYNYKSVTPTRRDDPLRYRSTESYKLVEDNGLEMGEIALCYPSVNSSELKEDYFKSFFLSPGSKASKAGFKFDYLPYNQSLARTDPKFLAESIIKRSPNCSSVLLTWTNRHINNKPLEFEFLRRNIAVQNMVDEGKKENALKMSAITAGMMRKFPVKERTVSFKRSIVPFDVVAGLDISRHGSRDVAAFPIAFTQNGRTICNLPDTYIGEGGKEKRNEKEVADIITRVANSVATDRAVNVLFLRDGIAFEDYDAIATMIPHNITLTVISVKKNLLNMASSQLPTIEGNGSNYYAIHARHDADRFVFGINAVGVKDSNIKRMHMATIVRNPLKVAVDDLSEMMVKLCHENPCSEAEVASLPMPIAYADRMAGTIREMINDPFLIGHVKKNYTQECDEAGGPSHFIYQEIKRFIDTRANGYTFAI